MVPIPREYRFKCIWCSMRFKSLSHWTRHIFQELSIRRTSKCPNCNLRFRTRERFTNHLIARDCLTQYPISICGYCDLKCGTTRSRIRHQHDCEQAIELMITDIGENLFNVQQQYELDLVQLNIESL